MTLLGAEGNLLHPTKKTFNEFSLETPILTNNQISSIKRIISNAFKSRTIDYT